MTAKIKLFSLLLIAIIGIFGLPGATRAYVLCGPHILELVAKNIGYSKTGLEIDQALFLYSDENGTGDVEEKKGATRNYKFKETALYKFPNRFRSDIWTDDLQQIYVYLFGQVLKIVDNKITSTQDTVVDLYKDIFLCQSRQRLIALLNRQNIDVSISSLGRFMGHIAFVIGAQYPDENVSQLWIDKETFMPLRWLIVTGDNIENEEKYEIRYFLWQPAGKMKYPKRIEFFQNTKLTRMILVKSIKTDSSAPDNLFNIPQLKKMYYNATLENTGKPDEETDVLQDLIDDFKNRLPTQ